MQKKPCDARSYAKNPPPRFHKLGDVDGRRLRFCGRFAKGVLGAAVFAAATKEKCGPVGFELFFGSFSLQ